MVRARNLLQRLPVGRRVVGTIDALRQERDALRQERDTLREELERLRGHPTSGRQRRGGTEGSPTGDIPQLLREPSFFARTEALRRVRRRSLEMHGHADPVWAFNDKLAGCDLAESLGVPTPERLVPPAYLADLVPPRRRCVVKPVGGASARGIAPLVPQPGDLWLDLFEPDKGARPWDAIRAGLSEAVARGGVSDRFFVEELLDGPDPLTLPHDWKVFCVGGEAVLTYGRSGRNRSDPREARFRYFSSTWDDLGPIQRPEQTDPTLALPHHTDELLRAAETIAAALPTLFVRVDLFDTPDRVVFGEITPQPGNPLWFGHDLDRSIGEIWDRAEAASWVRAAGS